MPKFNLNLNSLSLWKLTFNLVVDSGWGYGVHNYSHRNSFHIPALQIYFLLTNTVEKNSTSQNFTVLIRIKLDRPSVAVNSIVITFFLSETSNSSDVIGQIQIISSLASFNLRIIAAITSCIPLDNYKSISFSIKTLLYFIRLNNSLLPKRLNTTGTLSSKFSDPL